MLDDNDTNTTSTDDGSVLPTTATGVPDPMDPATEGGPPPAKKTAKKAAKRTTRKSSAKPAAEDGPAVTDAVSTEAGDTAAEEPAEKPAKKTAKKTAKKAAKKAPAKKTATKRTAAKKTASKAAAEQPTSDPSTEPEAPVEDDTPAGRAAAAAATALLFKAPEPTVEAPRKKTTARAADGPKGPDTADDASGDVDDRDEPDSERSADEDEGGDEDEPGGTRRRRRRGGRRRRKSGGGDNGADEASDDDGSAAEATEEAATPKAGAQRGKGPKADDATDADSEGTGTRRRRRRRRAGEEGDNGSDDPEKTVTRVRKPRTAEDEITSVSGSTRLEAKKQRRREGREAGRRRAPIVSEAEFLARREAVERVMVIRQRKDLTQIAVLEDKVLVEHYVARESQTSLIGNVYLGRVQNVLPSMEAAFIDIGKGRNAVLYAGEVNWDALGAGNGQRKIEQVLKSGQPILVQVTKDPIGHKGARLTSQVSLPGRFLVYVPDGTTSGISRKLPDTERNRLKTLLKEIVPDSAGVIVRTAAEGASEEELTHDVERLTARWSDIESKVAKGNAPELLYGEPDLTLKVVRDLFTEDFAKLVVSGDDAWDMVDGYVEHVAPDLADRLERYAGEDVFADYRIDEQIAKGLDRKVWLPSGGSLIIDRTEAMTVVDVNTGKFTGSGGNLEETVTKNNLEAAEEIVRQLRLRDIGGIIVVDFIDMVLENNRDLVLRRLLECLGRDRTRHQVAEVTSLGLVQMTRKRIGTGLLEAFSETCEHCQGRGLVIHHEPVEPSKRQDDEPRRGRRGRNRGGSDSGNGGGNATKSSPSPKDIAAMARHEPKPAADEPSADTGTDSADQPEPTEQPSGSGDSQPTGGESDEPTVEAPAGAEPEAQPDPQAEAQVSSGRPSSAQPAEATPELEPVSAGPDREREPEPVPAGPRLVTSTRRRVARRPAGPPAAVSTTPAAASDSPTDGAAGADATATADADGGGDSGADGEGAETPHVPVKKKGARKR